MFVVSVLAYALLANAQMVLEDTSDISSQQASYQEVYLAEVPFFPEEKPINNPDIPESVFCSCVETAKWITGRASESWGNAWEIKVNTEDPEVGDIVLTYEGPGHVGVIIETDEFGFWIDDGNYIPCQRTKRYFQWESPLIRGFKTFNEQSLGVPLDGV